MYEVCFNENDEINYIIGEKILASIDFQCNSVLLYTILQYTRNYQMIYHTT